MNPRACVDPACARGLHCSPLTPAAAAQPRASPRPRAHASPRAGEHRRRSSEPPETRRRRFPELLLPWPEHPASSPPFASDSRDGTPSNGAPWRRHRRPVPSGYLRAAPATRSAPFRPDPTDPVVGTSFVAVVCIAMIMLLRLFFSNERSSLTSRWPEPRWIHFTSLRLKSCRRAIPTSPEMSGRSRRCPASPGPRPRRTSNAAAVLDPPARAPHALTTAAARFAPA